MLFLLLESILTAVGRHEKIQMACDQKAQPLCKGPIHILQVEWRIAEKYTVCSPYIYYIYFIITFTISVSLQFSQIFTLNTNHLYDSLLFISVPHAISLKFQIHRGRLAIFSPRHNFIKPAHELYKMQISGQKYSEMKISQCSHKLFSSGIHRLTQ